MKLIQYLVLFLLSFSVLAYPTDEEGNLLIPDPLKAKCLSKGEVAHFVYQNRDRVSEEDALKVLERDWNETWADVPTMTWATYVDMQRIVRDAYRTDGNGGYKRECCNEAVEEKETVKEMQACLWNDY